MRPESDEALIRRLQELQIAFDAGAFDGDGALDLLAETMDIQRELRERGVSEERVAEAVAAIDRVKDP